VASARCASSRSPVSASSAMPNLQLTISRPFCRWPSLSYKHLQCSVLIAQTEIGDEEFERLLAAPP
jgi:hypothetical protein